MYSLNDSILIIPHILPNQYSWQLFSDKPGKIILNFFSCRKISNILPMQNPHNTFLLIFFISDLIRDEKICILLSTYFSTLMRSDMVLTSDFNFPFVTSTPFSMCFAVDVETTHSKRILSFFALLNLMNRVVKFFSSSFLKMEDLQLSTLHILVFFFSKTRKSMNMPISTSKKNTFFQE